VPQSCLIDYIYLFNNSLSQLYSYCIQNKVNFIFNVYNLFSIRTDLLQPLQEEEEVLQEEEEVLQEEEEMLQSCLLH